MGCDTAAVFPPLCSKCFSNIGLQREAERISEYRNSARCERCGNVGGAPLDRDAAYQLLSNVFVFASVPPEIGGPAYTYQFNEHRFPGEVEFGTEIDSDLRLLSDLLHVGLFHYGPPLWRLGYTEHYSALRDGATAEREAVWEDILGRCGEVLWGANNVLFRVRKGDDLVEPIGSQFDSPPASVRVPGRFGRYDSEDLPILYLSDNVETCLHECRVTLSDYITIAALRPTRELKLMNLADGIDDSKAQSEFESVTRFLVKLAYCGKQDYDLCKELARRVKEKGYDGFIYLSYFRQAHEDKLTNVALFGYPVHDGLLSLASVNRLQLTQVSYDYRFGPPQDVHEPPDSEEIGRLCEEMPQAQGGENGLKVFADRLKAILARRRR